jgi:hypothetical protein
MQGAPSIRSFTANGWDSMPLGSPQIARVYYAFGRL